MRAFNDSRAPILLLRRRGRLAAAVLTRGSNFSIGSSVEPGAVRTSFTGAMKR